MNPDEAVEMENLRAIVKEQATKLELLSEQLAMTLRSKLDTPTKILGAVF